MKEAFYTIGHSTRSIDEFVRMLESVEVTFVVDVRTVPRSRTNPQYNRDVLPQSLASFQIGYEHIAALGGLRGKARDVPPDVNAFWRNASFHNYADYAMGNDFRAGLARLRELGRVQRSAIMCAEALWWRCHRRIIADHLLAAGEEVFHLIGPGKVEQAHMTAAAHLDASGALTYPAAP
ncbi:MAG: DUF488 domain-containing protein [Bryobacterales bacterium]|nr:DUF488 domain-containing protein [Bryobacterales bacterium]